jgi:hypothetical protein
MDFPILDLMDQDGCYHKLLDLLHPDGLVCLHCAAWDGLNVPRHRPESAVVDYRCKGCCRDGNRDAASIDKPGRKQGRS